ncbi:MAG TPA: AarF/UbiB family protein [Vicinamibacterales bacterium]|nr:AarF/UbiB family protein [Vicinamibacterales bacterium]
MPGTSTSERGTEPRRRRPGMMSPARLHALLLRQGPTFVKIGQFLALRPDILPKEYCDELLKLVDRVPPFPSAAATTIIAADLGRSIEELFDWFNPQPIAAGSLAQVHEAVLADGRRVAVKVQRPQIRERVERDLRRLGRLVRLLRLAGVVTVVDSADLLAELRRWMGDELDMRRELANVERLYRLNADNPRLRIPAAFPNLSGDRVVTTEFLPGVPFSELLQHINRGDANAVAALGFSREQLSENLLWSVLQQIFRNEFFHADTHPGNLLALPGDVVGFVDFGFAETIDPTVRAKHVQYLAALYLGEPETVYRGVLEILELTPQSDVDGFRRDFMALTRAWNRDKDLPLERPGAHSPLSAYMVGLMRSARDRRLGVPPEVLSMYRSLLTGETVAHQLGGSADLRSVGAAFFASLQYDQLFQLIQPAAYQALFLDVLGLLRHGPGDLQRILSDLAAERLTLHVKTEEEREDRRQANARSGLISAAVIFLGLAVLVSGGDDVRLFAQVRLAHVLWAAMGLAAAFLLILWRRLS